MTSATLHRRLLRLLAGAMLATTVFGLPIEGPRRKLRMAEAEPVQSHQVVEARQA
ncbi:hypothetical protein [Luteolibacter sp. Populi]|uniref:hypothetical protein n=1 Tax=Luteolibacter sp. Populi TaxID=3230487 RepID=UPI00346601EA